MVELKAVFFDAGNTLLHINCRQLSELSAKAGVEIPADRLKMAEHRASSRISRYLGGSGSMEADVIFRQYVKYILRESGLALSPEKEDEIFRRFLEVQREMNLWNDEDPHAKEVLGRLGARFTLAVISNSDGKVEELLEEHGLRRFLDFVIDSGVVGVEKPDPRIFEIGLDRAGVSAGEAVYVGDIHAIDIVGAERAGITGILLDPIGCYGEEIGCLRARDLLEVEQVITRLASAGSDK